MSIKNILTPDNNNIIKTNGISFNYETVTAPFAAGTFDCTIVKTAAIVQITGIVPPIVTQSDLTIRVFGEHIQSSSFVYPIVFCQADSTNQYWLPSVFSIINNQCDIKLTNIASGSYFGTSVTMFVLVINPD